MKPPASTIFWRTHARWWRWDISPERVVITDVLPKLEAPMPRSLSETLMIQLFSIAFVRLAQARTWYERARNLGSEEAKAKLGRFPKEEYQPVQSHP